MKTIKYIGSSAVEEFPYTGKYCQWQPGQKQQVDDTRAAALLAADGWGTVSESVNFNSMSDFTNAGGASAFGEGSLYISGQLYWCDGVGIVPARGIVLSTTNTANTNTAIIQSALDAAESSGEGEVVISCAGVAVINPIFIGSNVTLTVTPGTTLKLAAGNNTNMLRTKTALSAGVSATVTWTSGETATVTWTGHTAVANGYVYLQGATQSEYRGVFFVKSVTDANNFVIALERTPTVTASGTITALIPTSNVTLNIYGTLDYDYLNNSAGAGYLQHAVILTGYNITVNKFNCINAQKYCLCIAAVKTAKISNVKAPTTHSDIVKLYGPAFDVEIDGIRGIAGDDVLSLQPTEGPAYAAYVFSAGDVLNVRVKNIFPDKTSTATLALYPTANEIIDNVTIDGVQTAINAIKIMTTTTAARIGKVFFSGLVAKESAGGGFITVSLPSGTIDLLSFSNTDFLGIGAALNISAGSIETLVLDKVKSSTAGALSTVQNSGTVNNMIVNQSNIFSAGSNVGRFVNNLATLNKLTFTRCNIKSIDNIYISTAAATAGTNITLEGCYINNCWGLLNMSQSSTVTLIGNSGSVNAGGNGAVRINGAGKTCSVTSYGNTFTGKYLVKVAGTELVDWNGTDLPIDIALLNRAVAGQMVKASIAAGTIVANNIAVNDATNAANSWKQLSNTTLTF